MSVAGRLLFVGLGSPHGDDQIGWRVADELERLTSGFHHVSIRKAAVPLDLLDWLDGIECLHLCDACCSGEPAGTLLKLDVSPAESPPPGLQALKHLRSGSSHDFGVVAVLDLAARLGCLPERVVVFAVSGRRFDPAAAMIEPLADAVATIGRTILQEMIDA